MRKLIIIPLLFLFSCDQFAGEERDKTRLNILLKSDLEYIQKDVTEKFLLEEPYYEVVTWKRYEEGIYMYLTEVDFYFLKPEEINQKIFRKYRFNKRQKKWERYVNEYRTIKKL